MSTSVKHPQLSIDADGTARIDGTRYKVLHPAGEHYHYGWSAEEVLRQRPDLRPEQVYAALTYFYDYHDAVVEALSKRHDAARREASKPSITRAELLKRRLN